jgi:hypothetical protein
LALNANSTLNAKAGIAAATTNGSVVAAVALNKPSSPRSNSS